MNTVASAGASPSAATAWVKCGAVAAVWPVSASAAPFQRTVAPEPSNDATTTPPRSSRWRSVVRPAVSSATRWSTMRSSVSLKADTWRWSRSRAETSVAWMSTARWPCTVTPRSETCTGSVSSASLTSAYSMPWIDEPSRWLRSASSRRGSTGNTSRRLSMRPPRMASKGSPVTA